MQHRPSLTISLLLTLAGCAASATANNGSCPQFFAGGIAPVVVIPKMAERSTQLCKSDYAALDSGLTRTPLWSAEHLTRAGIAAARSRHGVRDGAFHPEETLGADDRAELEDYVRSGYDRGHLSPSGDMDTVAADHESFSLANIVPQAPQLNRHQWDALEGSVRGLSTRYGEVFVVTGPIFAGATVIALHHRVAVPTSLWKAVYVPGHGAAAFVASNSNRPTWTVVSVDKLKQLTGLDVFPMLSAQDHRVIGDIRVSWVEHRIVDNGY